jgi:hypothetical protein
MKVNFKGVDLPPSPTLIKWYSAVTLATLSLPVWINETPFNLSQISKDGIEWAFKGVNVILSILAVFHGLDPKTLANYASVEQKKEVEDEKPK